MRIIERYNDLIKLYKDRAPDRSGKNNVNNIKKIIDELQSGCFTNFKDYKRRCDQLHVLCYNNTMLIQYVNSAFPPFD